MNYFIRLIRNAQIKVLIRNDFISAEKFYSELTPEDVNDLALFIANFLEVDLCQIEFLDDIKNKRGYITFQLNENKIIPEKIILRKQDLKYKNDDERRDFLAGLVHEIRHLWQAVNNKLNLEEKEEDIYSSDELDARAFSHIFMEYFVSPCPEYYDEKLNKLVERRENEIELEFLCKLAIYIKNRDSNI